MWVFWETALKPVCFGILLQLLFSPICSMVQILKIGSGSTVLHGSNPSQVWTGVLSFSFGVWSLWLWRNKMVFRDTSSQRSLKSKTIARASEFAFLGVNGKVRCPVVSVQVQWHKLNTDGSSLGNPGLIRDSNGAWVSGYARAIGHTTSVAAESWAIRDGINLCINLNLANVVVELDAKIEVDLLLKEGRSMNDNDVIVANCREGLRRIPRVQVRHCYREANKCAD